ncbi:MAG: hypothetical protein GF353_29165 [Candidatus Lokiarchaeota archaeon]|nr:hypothetical protein [Candidatus Lokiarchaeota archaeon]
MSGAGPNPKMMKADALIKEGKYQEAILILKEIVDEEQEPEELMFAAGLITSTYSFNILNGEPDPGTPEYQEIRKYLEIELESYDKSAPEAQEAFRSWGNDIALLRKMHNLMKDNKSLSELMPPQPKKSGGCFIATAIYGSYYSPEVQLLRQFRDIHLEANSIGKKIVQFYYLISPTIANYIIRKPSIKKIFKKFILGPVIVLIEKRKDF